MTKRGKNLTKAGIVFIMLTMILPTVAQTTLVTKSIVEPDKIPLNLQDTTPPIVKIEKPARAVYLLNKSIIPRLIRLTLIIGRITIVVNATDNESGIDRVEFYGGIFGRKPLGKDTTEPYTCNWKRGRVKLFHIQKLKVVAYNLAGNSSTDSIIVRKIL